VHRDALAWSGRARPRAVLLGVPRECRRLAHEAHCVAAACMRYAKMHSPSASVCKNDPLDVEMWMERHGHT
jgi:hypothetical protein